MTQYEKTLRAIHKLLAAVGATRWAGEIQEDLEAWCLRRDAVRHLSHYGGMGSFNDIVICQENKHRITRAREPWVNTLFEWLKSLCFRQAQEPNRHWSADELRQKLGRLDSILVAFRGGDQVDDSIRELSTKQPQLSGARCRQCGHNEVTVRELEWFIANLMVPGLVITAAASGRLGNLVKRVLTNEIDGAKEHRASFRAALRKGGVKSVRRTVWMRPCPACQTDDTAVFYWVFCESPAPHFVAAENNLPLYTSRGGRLRRSRRKRRAKP